jgi:hypothetical protein
MKAYRGSKPLTQIIPKLGTKWRRMVSVTLWPLLNSRKAPSCWLSQFLVKLSVCVDCVRNAMAHAQKPDFVFRRNGRVHLNRKGRQVSRLLASEVCASAVVMLDTPCSNVVWRVLATHSICQFPLHFPPPPMRHHLPSPFSCTLPPYLTSQDVTYCAMAVFLHCMCYQE